MSVRGRVHHMTVKEDPSRRGVREEKGVDEAPILEMMDAGLPEPGRSKPAGLMERGAPGLASIGEQEAPGGGGQRNTPKPF